MRGLCPLPLVLILGPRPSAPRPSTLGTSAPKYCKTKYNTTINFWGSYHLKTSKYFLFCFCFNYKWCKKQKTYEIMIVCKKTDEWYIEWHRMITSDNEWQHVVQRMTTSDNEWHRVVQGMTTSDSTSDNE